MKRYAFSVVIVLLVLVAGCRTGTRAPERKRHVVVLSLDGFRWDYAVRGHTPTLDSLKAAGSYAQIYPCFPANTFPNHYAMATGLQPDHHGIVANRFYDTASGRTFALGDSASSADPYFWRGEPIWEVAERQGMRTAVFMWVGCGARSKASRVEPFDGRVSPRQRAQWVLDELMRPADSVAQLIMWYLQEPDHEGHQTSPDSTQIIRRVEELDELLGWFFREARRSPVFDRTDFIVTSDHGMAAVSPSRCIHLHYLLDTARIVRAVDGNPLYLEPEPSYTDEALRLINARQHVRAWRRSQIPAEYRYGTDTARIASVIVLPDAGWTATYRTDTTLHLAGNHGYAPLSQEMQMIFYASGPDFRTGYTATPFQNLNLHVLIAHLLGIEPATPNDCDLSTVKGMLTR